MSTSGYKQEKAGNPWIKGIATLAFMFATALGLTMGKAVAEEDAAIFQYVKTTPIIVNVQSERRRAAFLKVTPVLVTQDEAYAEYLETNMPMVRNSLLSLYSNLTAEELLAQGGLDTMKEKTLKNLQALMGVHRVNDVLFNEFIVQ